MTEATHHFREKCSESVTENHIASAAEVHLLYVGLFNDGKFDEALAYVDANIIDHVGNEERRSIDAWRALRGSTGWVSSFERLSIAVEQNVSSGEHSTNRFRMSGTHKATQKQFSVRGIDMIRVQNGKIVEQWGLLDQESMRMQLT